MFKKMIKSAVAAMLASSASSALATDLTGVYTAQSQGQEITLELQGSGSDVRGVVRVNGQQLPLAAREYNGNLEGAFRGSNGQTIQIAGMQTNNGLSLVANGVTYQFGRANDGRNTPAGFQPQNLPDAQPNVPTVVPNSVQTVQGEIFSLPVPQGWQTSQSTNEAAAAAPDASMSFGFVGLERYQAMSAPNFLKFIVNMYGNKNLQIVDMRQINFQGATQAIEAKVTLTGPNGVNYTSWMRVAVYISGNQMNGYAVYTSATPEKFDRVAGQLQAMAEKIQITNASLAFDRARALNNIKMVKNNPMDDTVTSSYWDRSHRMDGVFSRGSDVRRDSYTSTDPTTGREYYHGQAAYDPTRGGVVNPERPTEILTPANHWQGR